MISGIPRVASSAADQKVDGTDTLFIRATARAMQVLGAFHQASGPLSLSEIATRAGIDRSAAQRNVHTLMKLGYLRRDRRGYLPGIRLLDHTLDVLRLDPVVQIATPVLMELRKTVRERVDFSLYDRTRLIYALRMQSKRETFYASLVGHSVPTYCTAGGRAALSLLSDEAARQIIDISRLDAHTPMTCTDPAQILEHIRTARRNGYARVIEEYAQGEIAVGVAISSGNGLPLGAIHVAGSRAEWTPEDFERRVSPVATEAARAINGSL